MFDLFKDRMDEAIDLCLRDRTKGKKALRAVVYDMADVLADQREAARAGDILHEIVDELMDRRGGSK